MEDDDWSFSRNVQRPTAQRATPSVKASPVQHVGRNFLDLHGHAVNSPAVIHLPGPRIEVRGFPQGFGTSPILFNFAFEMFALRDHFAKLDPSVKVISYADDFLVFSQVPLPTVMELPNNGSGLEVNLEKSRALIANGKPLVNSFKYLGATVHFKNGKFIWEGTPRSGTHLIFDKDMMVKDFEYREEQIRKFIAGVEGSPKSPGAVISAWGLGEYPSALLPEEVIRGEAPVTNKLIKSVNAICKEHNYLEGIPEGQKAKVSAIAEFSDNLQKRLRSANSWLRSRIAGLLVNRLHAGTWKTPEVFPDTTQTRVDGSWLELRRKSEGPASQIRLQKAPKLSTFIGKRFTGNLEEYKAHLNSLQRALKLVVLEQKERASFVTTNSIYTGTSLATEDLLTHFRNPIKVRKGKLVYKTKS